MTQVNIVEPSASQADSAGSIPVIGSTKNTLPPGNSRNPNAATTGTVPNTAPNALPLDSPVNRTNATRPAIAASLPTTEPLAPRQAPAFAETVHVLNWIAAELRDALDSPFPEDHARRLLADVSLWTSDTDEPVAAITQRTSLPALDWARRAHWAGYVDGRDRWVPGLTGTVDDYEHPDHVAVALAWATELRLTEEAEPSSPGIRAWQGTHEGWRVRIWTITDRTAFYAG